MKMNKKVMGLVLAGMMSIGMMTGCSDSAVEEQNNNNQMQQEQTVDRKSVV